MHELTCSTARTAFVQAPQGHRSYFACQDCTCRKKRRMHFDFLNIFACTYFTCLWECTVSHCFSLIWSLQLLHWQSWIWQWQVFFSRQSLNVMMESGFMMKEHLIERGTFGLRFCWNVDPEEESQQMSRRAMIWSKNLVDVKVVGEWNCHFLWWWKSHQLHEIFRWFEYPATSRGAVSSPHPNHLPPFFPPWIFHSFLVLLLSLLAPSIANLRPGCKGLWKALDLSAIQIGRKNKKNMNVKKYSPPSVIGSDELLAEM